MVVPPILSCKSPAYKLRLKRTLCGAGERRILNNETAKTLVCEVFEKLSNANSVKDIESIVVNNKVLWKNRFNPSKYPELKISLSAAEISNLVGRGILTNENKVSSQMEFSNLTPLEKILYSVLWKNGDLGKERHIVEGVTAACMDVDDLNRDKSLVFYQFGRHLANREEPIVDQHTIRAFLLFKYDGDEESEITRIRKIAKVGKEDLAQFKEWLNSHSCKNIENQFHIDKDLFALGKAIKFKKQKNT